MNEKLLEKIELFNVGELRAHPMGWLLARYPERVCTGLSSLGAYIGSHACGCEIRFVRENPEDAVDVTLLCVNASGSIVVMQGDFWVEKIEFAPGELKTVTIRNSPILQEENEAFFAENCFSRNVTRLICSVAEFVLCDVRSNGKAIRPPEREELPKYTCLAYGSSITQGGRGYCNAAELYCTGGADARFAGAQQGAWRLLLHGGVCGGLVGAAPV